MNLVLQKFRILGKKGEGTFSEVLKCQNISDGTYWACKKMKQSYDSLEQVNNLREIQAMRRLSPHPHILELHEVIFDKKSGTLALICELMDMNIYELIKGKRVYLPEQTIQSYMFQLVKALEHMQKNGIFHRDVKPENILIKEDLLKLADFGSCRSVFSKQPYTEYISTRWYRAPECLLTDGYYTYKMDMWSVGCVFFEVLSLHPLFPGSNEVDQIAKIHDIIGTPEPNILNKFKKSRGMNFNFPTKKGSGIERLLPHTTPESIDLIYKMCTYDPDERITAKQAIKHAYFKEFRDADKRAAILARKQLEEANENAVEVVRKHRQSLERSYQEPVPDTHHSEKGADRKALVQDLAVYPSIPKAQSLPSHTESKKDANFRRRRRSKRTTGTFQYSNHTGLLPRVSMHESSPKYQSTSFQNTLLPTTKYNTSSYLPNISNSFRSQKPRAGLKTAGDKTFSVAAHCVELTPKTYTNYQYLKFIQEKHENTFLPTGILLLENTNQLITDIIYKLLNDEVPDSETLFYKASLTASLEKEYMSSLCTYFIQSSGHPIMRL